MYLPVPLTLASRDAQENSFIRRVFIGLAALAIGCAVPVTAASNSASRFEHLHQQELRVAHVTYTLAVANRKLCQDALKPQLGFVLHILENHVPTSHKAAVSSHGLGRYPGVIAVAGGSPAARAGLVAGG